MSEEKQKMALKEALVRKHKAERKDVRKECTDALDGKKGDERSTIEKENAAKTEALKVKHAEEVEKFELGEVIEGLESFVLQQQPAKEKPTNAGGKPMTKAQIKHMKMREKEKEAQRQREEQRASAGPSQRQLELERVAKILDGLGLEIKEVEGDGHCLFRAIADQLIQSGGSSITPETKDPHLMLRVMCAQFMKEHKYEFEPFLAGESDQDAVSFDKYLDRLKNTSEWGGQLELRALAGVLQTPIRIIDPDTSSPLVMGEDFSGTPLTVTFHRHFLTLGEHYNSVQPKGTASP